MAWNIEEPQVLVECPDDGVPCYHRVLFRRLREAVWIVAKPERDVQIEDLSSISCCLHVEGHPSPGRCHTPLRGHNRRRAGRMTSPGCTPGSNHGSCRRERGCSSLAHCRHLSGRVWRFSAQRGIEPPRWLFCEHVPNAELAAWEADKHAEAGRDRRLGAPALANAGSVISFGDAMASFRPRELKDVTDWPQKESRGAAFDPRAGGRSYHLPQPAAATIAGSLRSGSVLGAQTLVSDPGARLAVRLPRCDQRRRPGTGQPAVGDDRTSSQAQPESSVLCWDSPHDRTHTL